MQLRGKFFHLDENCQIFKHMKEGEACFYKTTCDAICKLADGTAEYKRMRKEMDFRIFPDAWAKKEKEILVQVIQLIAQLEQKGNLLDAKRLKAAYGFDVNKRISASTGSAAGGGGAAPNSASNAGQEK